MFKKGLIYSLLMLFVSILQAQCPVSVTISRNPTGAVCRNTTVNFTAQPTNEGSNPQYFWVLNGDTVGTNPTLSTAVNGAHVELYVVTSNACTDTVAYAQTYLVNVDITLDYTVETPTECNQPTNDVTINNISGGTEPYSYYLHTDVEDKAESITYTDLPISSYPIIVTDAAGCVDTNWVDLTTLECDPIVPSQILTPNDDGINDTWYVHNIEFYPKNKVYIFDRWGQRVYYKEGYTNVEGWDAKYMSGNLPVTSFFYVIELEFERQDKQVFKGPVSILR
ncbi:MAG: gliding motility-associated C-terminal domain-containing protein [Flavobacteriales bacterium]|nr:gliding motility-associated C-terminal domain-containing protein [Flavobacteriales bacterium]MCB9335762.1 gliding motility-associated C-terminal domain-containing protein [Flavobacteriales bacterium]